MTCFELTIQSARRWLWLLQFLSNSLPKFLSKSLLESLRRKMAPFASFVRTPWPAPRTTWPCSADTCSIAYAFWNGVCAPTRRRWTVLCDADLKVMILQLRNLATNCCRLYLVHLL